MNNGNDTDQLFDRNLRTLGMNVRTPGAPSADVRARCASALRGDGSARVSGLATLRRPAWLSTIGLAAALAIAVGLFFPESGAPNVEAAVVLTKLTEQVDESTLIDVSIDAIKTDEADITARIQVANNAVAGDFKVTVRDGSQASPIEIDVSLAISERGGWILIRKLVVPVPEAKVILDMFMPEGTELLLKLPEELVNEVLKEGLSVKFDELHELASGQVVTLVKGIMESESAVGARVENQRNGTVLVTIPIKDAEAFENLIRLVARTMGEEDPGDIDVSLDDVSELVGATFSIVYDPRAEVVRSFSVSNLPEINGTVTVSLSTGSIDPDLLDPQRVTTAKTRTFDVGALMSMFKALESLGD